MEDGDGERGAEVVLPARHRHRAQAGAGAVLAVSAPQMLRKLAESDAGNLQLVPSLMVPERHCLVFLRVRPEHEVGVSPGRLGRLHLEGVVIVSVRMGGSSLPVPLGQSPQQARAQASTRRLLQLGKVLLLLLGLLRVLDDGVPVEGSAKVDLQDG